MSSANDKLVDLLRQKGITHAEVLAAIRATPRHLFVTPDCLSFAYNDQALPIEREQTISQPYIVARMTEALLAAEKPQKVLEVGTGSGYQAAVLAQLIPEVYTIERIQLLLSQARERFAKLKLTTIHSRFGDGNVGWPDAAPFEGIIVTAAARKVPQALLKQLAEGGRLIIPTGGAGFQELQAITRLAKGQYQTECLEAVVFVPLLHGTEA